MADSAIGLLHPGEMGAALAMQLRRGAPFSGRPRAAAPRRRRVPSRRACATSGTVEELAESSDVILSVCPPHAALDVAESVAAGFDGIYVDANAVSPHDGPRDRERRRGRWRTVRGRWDRRRSAADGVPTELYLSGSMAPAVADLFRDTVVQARIVSDEPGSASAVKMAYAAWTKGTAALLLAIRALARAEGVEATLARTSGRSPIPESARTVRPRRARGRPEGLAMGGGDGGDRPHVRRGRTARRLPRGRGRDLSAFPELATEREP